MVFSNFGVQVYKEIADTEIPRLQEFLQELGEEHRRRRTEQLLHCLHQLLSDIKGHLSDSGLKVRVVLLLLHWNHSNNAMCASRKLKHFSLRTLLPFTVYVFFTPRGGSPLLLGQLWETFVGHTGEKIWIELSDLSLVNQLFLGGFQLSETGQIGSFGAFYWECKGRVG